MPLELCTKVAALHSSNHRAATYSRTPRSSEPGMTLCTYLRATVLTERLNVHSMYRRGLRAAHAKQIFGRSFLIVSADPAHPLRLYESPH